MCLMCENKSRNNNVLSPSRRSALAKIGAISMMAAGSLFSQALAAPPPKPENILTPDEALERLMKGNKRYASGHTTPREFASTRSVLATGQNPYASLLSCADSRVSPELCFDEARGDLFVNRIAGNYVTNDILASLEYGAAVLNSPLIMVLGHTSCGAINAAVKGFEADTNFPGHIQNIASALMPSVRAASKSGHEGTLAEAATKENIRHSVKLLQEATPILGSLVRNGKLKVVGGMYRLDSGRVELVT